jgi:hypothetical protein
LSFLDSGREDKRFLASTLNRGDFYDTDSVAKQTGVSLWSIAQHAMTLYAIIPRIRDIAQLHAAAPLLTAKGFTSTHWIGRWVGPRKRLDTVKSSEIPCLAGNRTVWIAHRSLVVN